MNRALVLFLCAGWLIGCAAFHRGELTQNASLDSGRVLLAPADVAYEHLRVSISATDAVFTASLTLTQTVHADTNSLAVSMWFPKKGLGDSTVEAFWRAFGRERPFYYL